MKFPSDTKRKQKRLTLAGSRNALILSCCLMILFAVMGFDGLKHGIKFQAGLACLAALGQLLNLPQNWKNYRQVKQGAEVYATAQVQMPVPKIVSATVALVLSGLVGVCSIAIVLAAHTSFNTLAGWSVAVGILLFLWLSTAYCWYRVLTDKPPVKPMLIQEQTEGVWPPAPLTAEADNWGNG